MGKEFDMFDDFFKEEDFQIEDEKEEELEELELETDDPEDYDPVPTPDPDADVDVTCDCDDDDGCSNCSLDPAAGDDLDPFSDLDPADDCDGDPDTCGCSNCDDGWDTGQKTKWDSGNPRDRTDPPPKSVWKQKTWKT